MLFIEWVGYIFVKHMLFYYVIMINQLFREIKLRTMCFKEVL
jgi:hypothetical protein